VETYQFQVFHLTYCTSLFVCVFCLFLIHLSVSDFYFFTSLLSSLFLYLPFFLAVIFSFLYQSLSNCILVRLDISLCPCISYTFSLSLYVFFFRFNTLYFSLFSLTFSLPTFLCLSYADFFMCCTLSCTFFSFFICISHPLSLLRISFSLLHLIYFYYFLSIFLSLSLTPSLCLSFVYGNFLSP